MSRSRFFVFHGKKHPERVSGSTQNQALSAMLRLQECLELRIKDLDFDGHEILVRRGKGQNHTDDQLHLRYPADVAEYRFTDYFETAVLKKRPYLRKEWCIQVVERPIRSEPQEHNRSPW